MPSNAKPEPTGRTREVDGQAQAEMSDGVSTWWVSAEAVEGFGLKPARVSDIASLKTRLQKKASRPKP